LGVSYQEEREEEERKKKVFFLLQFADVFEWKDSRKKGGKGKLQKEGGLCGDSMCENKLRFTKDPDSGR
jgi:hypothetical protein